MSLYDVLLPQTPPKPKGARIVTFDCGPLDRLSVPERQAKRKRGEHERAYSRYHQRLRNATQPPRAAPSCAATQPIER